MITEQQQLDAKRFRIRVKSQLALNDETMDSLAKRIDRRPATISVALKKPWEFPLVIAAIKADLFPGERPAKRKTSKKGAAQ